LIWTNMSVNKFVEELKIVHKDYSQVIVFSINS